jgi:hypothetical protein
MIMPEIISLMDLRRRSRIVPIDDGEQGLKIHGLTARQICDHLERFPSLATLSIGGTLTPIDALKAVPGALSAWIASACGDHKNTEAEAAAEENLTIEDASYIVQESMDLTFSRGFGPFAGRLGVVMSFITVQPGRAPDMKSPSRSPPSVEELMAASGTSPRASSPPTASSMNGAASPQAPPTSPMPPSEPEEKPTL